MALVYRLNIQDKEHFLTVPEISEMLSNHVINAKTEVLKFDGSWVKLEQYQSLYNQIFKESDYNNEPVKEEQTFDISTSSSNKIESFTKISNFKICKVCKHECSPRAIKCPKCQAEFLKKCTVCLAEISSTNTSCPECGDPNPFEIAISNNIIKNKNSKPDQILNLEPLHIKQKIESHGTKPLRKTMSILMKIILSIVVFLVGSVIAAFTREIFGFGSYIAIGILVFILFRIWK